MAIITDATIIGGCHLDGYALWIRQDSIVALLKQADAPHDLPKISYIDCYMVMKVFEILLKLV